MKRPLLRIATTLLAMAAAASAQPSFDEALRVATRKAGIPAEEVARATQATLWNPDKTAVAVALKRPEASVVLVFLRQKNGEFVIVDVSALNPATSQSWELAAHIISASKRHQSSGCTEMMTFFR